MLNIAKNTNGNKSNMKLNNHIWEPSEMKVDQ